MRLQITHLSVVFCSYPTQEKTGRRGYFLKRESVKASWQRKNTEPRSDSMRRAWEQSWQSPGCAWGADFSVGVLTSAE